MNTKIITLHEGREDHFEEFSDLWDLDAPQQDAFEYAASRLDVSLEVDLDTGKSRIIALNDVPLSIIGDFQ